MPGGRKKGQVPIDWIIRGMKNKTPLQYAHDKKMDESWWFYPKYKATKTQNHEKVQDLQHQHSYRLSDS